MLRSMAVMGIDRGNTFGIIEPEGTERPDLRARFVVRPLNGDRFLVTHPFHGPRTVGDRSIFPDPVIDDAAGILLGKFAYLADARKLNRPARFETRPFAGEFSQLSHCMSLGVMGVEFAGGALEIFDGLYNDSTHMYNGHQADDNYQGHGLETLHEDGRPDFFRRSGILGAFVTAGVLRPNGHGFHLGNTRLYIGSLLDEDEATIRNTFMSNKHSSRRMDGDRLQYYLEETFLKEVFKHRYEPDTLRVPNAIAEAAIDDVQRMVVLDGGEGDQLVFSNPEVAANATLEYVEKNALHWCEPVQDFVNDILNLAERYYFVCNDRTAQEHQYFYPRDYLHTSATLMYERFEAVAKQDEFMRWLLDTAERIARDQRQKMADIIDGKRVYEGPDPVSGLSLKKLDTPKVPSQFWVDGTSLKALLPKGKMRTVDPRVIVSRRETQPISVLQPKMVQEYADMNRWIGNYEATLELHDDTEVRVVTEGLRKIEEGWPRALRRTSMPDKEFQAHIQEASDFVVRHAA